MFISNFFCPLTGKNLGNSHKAVLIWLTWRPLKLIRGPLMLTKMSVMLSWWTTRLTMLMIILKLYRIPLRLTMKSLVMSPGTVWIWKPKVVLTSWPSDRISLCWPIEDGHSVWNWQDGCSVCGRSSPRKHNCLELEAKWWFDFLVLVLLLEPWLERQRWSDLSTSDRLEE